MDNLWIPSGVDQETAFRIEVKIEGFGNKQNDSRKVYVKGRTLKWVVDSDRFSLCDLISDISDEISWGSCQTLRICMFDKNQKKDVDVLSESPIPESFNSWIKEYVNNNISESFNSWIKEYKDLYVIDLVDRIRQLITVTFNKRRTIGSKLEGVILPNVIAQLNEKSRNVGKVRICRGGDKCAEVSGMDLESKSWRHAVELDKRECTCREWQLTGKLCVHAIAFICTLRGACMQDYVHEYFSIAKFRVAYEGVIRPMTDKSQWTSVDPEFKVHPPQMKRPPGRPRKERIPGCLEVRKRRQKCKQFGHQERTCKAPPVTEDPQVAGPSTNKRKRR